MIKNVRGWIAHTHIMACQKQRGNSSVPSVVVLGLAVPNPEGFDAVRNAFNAIPVLDTFAEDVAIWSLHRRIWHSPAFASAVIASNDATDRAKPDTGLSHACNDVVLNKSHVVAIA